MQMLSAIAIVVCVFAFWFPLDVFFFFDLIVMMFLFCLFVVFYFCVLFLFLCFFFFKQKTAYELRISDWSSDVCSSDLKPYGGWLLAGWIAIAVICGALNWRPHVWLTGSSGSGKSWLLDNVIRPLIGAIAVYCQSNSTEAGIRQTLATDARPVLFDEAESEDAKAQVRIQIGRAHV